MTLKDVSRRVLPPIAVDAGRWLLHFRTPAAPTRVRFQYGEFLLECDATHHLPAILSTLPNFGRNLADVVNALGVREPRVIDIGANIGDTAVLLARFAPGSKVLCIEGDSRFISDLKSNTTKLTGVTVAQAILSDRTGKIQGKFADEKGTGHVVLQQGGELLEMQTLDDLIAGYPEFSLPDVVKIDTDGFEPAILRGAKNILRASKPVVFYEWHPDCYNSAGEDDIRHADFLMDLGYEGFTFFTNRGELLLHNRRPGRNILESLAQYSRARRRVDNCHFDIAAFPTERLDAWDRLWSPYTKRDTSLVNYWPLVGSVVSSLCLLDWLPQIL